jgi:hypothetical protein
VIGHSGADAGYRSVAERYPDFGMAVVVLCNASNSGPGQLARRVADVLLGGSAAPTVATADTTPRQVSAAIREKWVGVWRDTVSESLLRIKLDGDTLRLSPGRRLVTTSDSTIRVAGGTFGAVMRTSPTGATTIAVVPSGVRQQILVRQPEFAPDRRALGAYTGSYVSDELDVRYEMVLGDSSLVLKQRKKDDTSLTPAFPDGFIDRYERTFIFTRDGKGRVTGFTVTDGRTRYVAFRRASG